MGWTCCCRHRGKSIGLRGLGSNSPLPLPCGRVLDKSFDYFLDTLSSFDK